MSKNFKSLLKFVQEFKIAYILVYVFTFFSVLFTAFTTYSTKVVVDLLTHDYVLAEKSIPLDNLIIKFLGGRDYLVDHLWIFAIFLVSLSLISIIFGLAKYRTRIYINTNISKRNMLNYFSHIQKLPYDYIKSAKVGDLIQRCSSDDETVRRFVVNQLIQLVSTVLSILITFAFLCYLDVRLAISSVAILPFFTFLSYKLVKIMRLRFKLADIEDGLVCANIQENLSAVRTVQAYNRQDYEISIFDKKVEDYSKRFMHWRKLSSLFFASNDFFVYGQQLLALCVGVVLAINQQITIGTLLISVSFLASISHPMREIGFSLNNYAKAIAAKSRIDEIMEIKEEDLLHGNNITIQGSIEFKNVYFKYPDAQDDCINGLSLSIKKGQTVAIMGKTGSGKTTLVQLLNRLYDVNKGEILIDGININSISKNSLRNQIGLVLQETFLFSKDIYQNIAIASTNDPDKVYASAKIAAIHNSILDFNLGYQTMVGEKGVTLSGGQKQRIAIARTLAKAPPILIFDDSLSAVDTQTDLLIRQGIRQRTLNLTSLIITHRSATAQSADLIVVLDNGKIAEIGTHEQLIQQNGTYKQIWDIQSRL
jgi:ATP-binding cassette subfamily B protein